MENSVFGTPFVPHVSQTLRPEIKNVSEFIKKVYEKRFYTNSDNIFRTGFYKNGGYSFNLRPYLKLYLFKQYGEWREFYAPNKTLLRKQVYGRIDKIIEL